MKKILLLAIVLLPFIASSQTILTDDFESYTAGELLAANSDLWTTWSGGVDAEDAYVSNAQASSGVNSVNIAGNNGPTDLVLAFPEDYTSGVYEFSTKVFIASGAGGYFNVQSSCVTIGQHWMFEIWFDNAGGGYINAGGANVATFTYTPDTWNDFKLHVDIDNDQAEVFFNSGSLYSWQWSLGYLGGEDVHQIGGLDFYATAANGGDANFYLDDVKLVKILPTIPGLLWDDFESYTSGELLASQSDLWTTWSGGLDGEDAYVSSDQAVTGSNSVHIVGNNGPTDLILPFPEDYTSGVYEFSVKMYVKSGYGGYWNIQASSTPGVDWMFEIYFDNAGGGYINAGASNAATFTYTPDTWLSVNVRADLDNDEGQLFINSHLIHTWIWSTGALGTSSLKQMGGVDIYSAAPNNGDADFYIDNMLFKQVTLTGVFVDDFESYVPDQKLAVNSDVWTTWSGGIDSEDPPISGLNAAEGFNSIHEVGNNGPYDLILPFPEDYTSDIVQLEMKMYITGGYGAYFNAQQTAVPGTAWMFDMYADNGGGGTIWAGGQDAASFTYTPDTWFDIKLWVDLTNDLAEFFIDGQSIYSWQWSLGDLGTGAEKMWGGIDIWSAAANNGDADFYVDDVVLSTDEGTAISNLNIAGDIQLMPNPSDGHFDVRMNNLPAGDYQLQLVDMLGRIISNENMNISGSVTKHFDVDLSKGVYFIKLNDGNHVTTKKMVVND